MDKKNKRPTPSARCILALSQLDKHMQTNNLTAQDIVTQFDINFDQRISRHELCSALLRIDGNTMSIEQADELLSYMDTSNDGLVDVGELDRSLKDFRRMKKDGTMKKILDGTKETEEQIDTVYPNWLVHRSDFQNVFSRFDAPMAHSLNDSIIQASRALRAPPMMRSEEQLHQISRWFLERSAFSRHLGDKTRLAMAKHLTFMQVPPKAFVFKQGDIGDAFYIVFSGTVDVVQGGDQKVVASINSGGSFGEVALQSDQPRNASIRAQGAVELVRLSRRDYNAILKKSEKDKIRNAKQFFMNECEISRAWPLSRIESLAREVTWVFMDFGETVFDSKEDSGGMYFLVAGSCEATRIITKAQRNTWPCTKRGDRQSRPTTHEIELKLRDFRTGDVFGEDCVIEGASHRLYNVKVTSNVATFLIIGRERAATCISKNAMGTILDDLSLLHEPDEKLTELYDTCRKRIQQYMRLRDSELGPQYSSRFQKWMLPQRSSQRHARNVRRPAPLNRQSADGSKGVRRSYTECILEAAKLGLISQEESARTGYMRVLEDAKSERRYTFASEPTWLTSPDGAASSVATRQEDATIEKRLAEAQAAAAEDYGDGMMHHPRPMYDVDGSSDEEVHGSCKPQSTGNLHSGDLFDEADEVLGRRERRARVPTEARTGHGNAVESSTAASFGYARNATISMTDLDTLNVSKPPLGGRGKGLRIPRALRERTGRQRVLTM